MKHTDVWGVKIINTTPHGITFIRWVDRAYITVPTSGTILHAELVHDELIVHGVRLIRTQYKGTEPGLSFLADIPIEEEGIIVVGSILSAQAYPGKVKSLVICKGYEKRAPHERIYHYKRFRIFI